MSGYEIKYFDSKKYFNEKVRVYRNLHNGLLSVQFYQKGKGWRLAGHTADLILFDCSFCVNETQRQRVIKKQKKEVHAYVIGEVKDFFDFSVDFRKFSLVTYNPYCHSSFIIKESKTPVTFAKYCLIQQCKVFVANYI